MYSEVAKYRMLKYFLPDAPVYGVLGNHDTGPESFDTPYPLPGTYGDAQQANYAHLADLWQEYAWIGADTATDIRTHYAAYSVSHPKYSKLKIIALNPDFWYIENIYNFINSSNPDTSGLFTFLVDALQSAKDAGQRVWIIGHIHPGWQGTQAMPSHSDLFYQIVERYSPHAIANIFFGHSHNDEMGIFYRKNGTSLVEEYALTPAWITPSITPLGGPSNKGHNLAWRFYEVDTGDFNVYDVYTFNTNVINFVNLDVTKSGPAWELEYSTRATYGDAIKWPRDAPLNATFWHRVTEEMKMNLTMVNDFNHYQGVEVSSCNNTACAE